MTDEKWEQIIGRIKDEFDVLSHQTLEEKNNGEQAEEIVFEGPSGIMKLERKTKPRLVEEKTHYSKRIGGDTSVERVYDEDDLVDVVELFKDNDGEWVPVDNSLFL